MIHAKDIVDSYREAIGMGRYSIGESLPSQQDMRDQFDGCSKNTVQTALIELEARGLISRQKGRNPIVTSSRGVRLPQDLTRAELLRLSDVRDEWAAASVELAELDMELSELMVRRAKAALVERRTSAALNTSLSELMGRTIPDEFVRDDEQEDGGDPMEG